MLFYLHLIWSYGISEIAKLFSEITNVYKDKLDSKINSWYAPKYTFYNSYKNSSIGDQIRSQIISKIKS